MDSDYSEDDRGPSRTSKGQYLANSSLRSAESRLCGSIDSKLLSHTAFNSVISSEAKAMVPRNLGLTKDTRATVEQVLDPRTMSVLSKMSKRGVFQSMYGCISTGKEANVYHAVTASGTELAIKIYKTSILVFKDRSAYVEGEFRFRNGYCRSNPRKMVALWAEKELRNLKRLEEAGIACPKVVEGRQNVVVMSFIGGENGKAAPRLKDAPNDSDWQSLYFQVCSLMQQMFKACKLVHGDLSEYNLLLLPGSNGSSPFLFVIDVSQSVEQDHPHALDFLKRDCVNVNRFFSSRGARIVGLQKLFAWILAGESKDSLEDDTLMAESLDQFDDDSSETDDDEVFMGTFIPSTLNQVGDLAKLEEELTKRSRGERSLCERLLAPKLNDDEEDDEVDDDSDDQDDESSEDTDASDHSDASDDKNVVNRADVIPEGMSKAEWKKKVKEENREKRKIKIPKKERKKEQKKHSHRKL